MMKFGSVALVTLCLLGTMMAQSHTNNEVTVVITNVESYGGSIVIGFYATPEDYANFSNPVFSKVLRPKKGQSLQFVTTKLKPGEFAVAGYHDLNDNGKLDFGGPYNAPNEPLIFGNNAKGLYGAPEYDETLMKVSGNKTTIELSF